MPEKPRQVVPNLGDAPDLRPQARGIDSFARPGQTEYGKPAATNPFLQLSHALGQLEPRITQLAVVQNQQYSEAEYARTEQHYSENRPVWNAAIKAGTIPEGISPYFVKAGHRIALKQLGAELQSTMRMAYFGDAGTAARNDDNPATLTAFMAKTQQEFTNANLKNGEKNLFTPLDVHEVFNPAVEQTYKTLQQTHAAYRVAEHEAFAENAAGAAIGISLTGVATNHRKDFLDEAIFDKALKTTGAEITNLFTDPRDGLRTNGMLSSVRVDVGGQTLNVAKSTKLTVDTVVANAIKADNIEMTEVLNYVSAGKGATLGNTQYAIATVEAARDHITSKRIQAERDAEHRAARPFTLASMQHSQEEWKRQDERYEHELRNIDRTDRVHSQGDIDTVYEKQVLNVLRRPDGLKAADGILQRMETEASTTATLRMRELLHTATKQKAEFVNSSAHDLTAARLRMDLSKDPLAFDQTRLYTALSKGEISKGTFDQYMDDHERNRQHGDHPFLRQAAFTNMLNTVSKGVSKTPTDEYTYEGAIRIGDAVGAFRDEASAWITEHPQGTAAQLYTHLRSRMKGVMESVSPELRQVGETAEKAKVATERKAAITSEAPFQPVTPYVPPTPAPKYPPAGEKAVSALLGAPTQPNIEAFVKHFGVEALPPSLKKKKP